MKKQKIWAALAVLAVVCGLTWVGVHAQSVPSSRSSLSNVAGVYDSRNYIYGAEIINGNTATGSQTILVATSGVLPDGRPFNPFASANGVFAPITVDPQGGSGVTETVTPTAVSQVSPCPANAPSNQSCYNVTASFSNLHGASLNTSQIISGDQGIQEAINDASLAPSGSSNLVLWTIDPGIVTLNTGGANTTLGSVNIPTRSVVTAATAKVTTTIGTCAGGWSLGFSTGTEFGAANTTLTAGTTTDSSTLVPMVAFNAAATAPIAHCTTSNASAGALHARFSGYKLVAPAN